MAKNQTEYEEIDDSFAKPTESVYLNPTFVNDEEVQSKLPLLDNLNNNEQSPYEEVAMNISNKDDPTMLCLTIRSVFIGILLTCFMSFTSQFFALRTSPLDFNVGIVVLLSYMIGQLMSKTLPEKIFNVTLNPGPFSVKEHALITIMASSATYMYTAVEILVVQRLYYNYRLDHLNAILFLIILQLIAFSIAGIVKRYLVWPAPMIWPKTLMICCLIRTLNADDDSEKIKSRWTMSRSKFFWLIVLFQFVWYWLPGYIFPLLSFFSFICMISPNNVVFSQITGANGLGLGAIELDWNAWVAYLDSPILVPFWAHVNMFVGFILAIWIATPILYYSNVWESKKMPIISNRVFDIDGYFYNTTKVLNSNFRLNETAYKIYGEMRMTTGYAVSYGFIFAGFSALILHTILYHGKSIVEQFRSSLSDDKNDIHAKLMSHYPAIAERWYYLVLVLSFIAALIHSYGNGLIPGYILFISIVLNIILIIPLGILTAITSITFATAILTDMLSGTLMPGSPLGYLGFRAYAIVCQYQILVFLSSFKIGHYMKIPPRILFPLLIVCPIISCIVNYLTALYLLNHVPNICTPKNTLWRCLNAEGTYTVSVIWGVVGATKLFGPDSKYFPLLFGFAIGLFLPIISWGLWKKCPNVKWLALVNTPVILLATVNIPPAPGAEFASWFLVGFVFNYILYRYAHLWWERYAYIFSAAMSCGVALCGFVIFFVFQNNGISFPRWWGTGGITGDGCPLAMANYSGILPSNRDL